MKRDFKILVRTAGVFVGAVLLVGCGGGEGRDDAAATTGHTDPAPSEAAPKSVVPFEDPEANYLLVEQAVDAWLYFHLSDYRSYEPLLRSTSYDAPRDRYLHHLRYRLVTPEGGPVTTEADFEVDLTRAGDNGIPFLVRPRPSEAPDS